MAVANSGNSQREYRKKSKSRGIRPICVIRVKFTPYNPGLVMRLGDSHTQEANLKQSR